MEERPTGVGDVLGGAAIYPARLAARAWRGRLETAAEEMLAAPETARILDRALAGDLPEQVARSLVRHRVLERVVRELVEAGELERLLASDEFGDALRRVLSGPEVRAALAAQSTGVAEDVSLGLRDAAAAVDRRAGRAALPGFAGVGTRGLALVVDAVAITAAWATAAAAAAIVASLVGGVRPAWLAGTLLGVGNLLVAASYFTLFWSTTGRTPGMRLLHVRLDRRLTAARALVRAVGLALAIVPLFAGFLPALVDERRRALPDYLAGTTVLYDP